MKVMETNGLKAQPLYVRRLKGGYKKSVYELCEAAGLASALARSFGRGVTSVLIKPNLVGTHAPPITTPYPLVEAIAEYILEKAPQMTVIVGDGTGSLDYETDRCFAELGYSPLARKKNLRLADLNYAELVELKRPGLAKRPVFHMPKIVMESFIISVPVLKAHTLAGVTLTMKNMIGVAPPSHYQAGGHWKKSSFHERIHESIFELNSYRSPDFTLLDATAAMIEAHLWGATLNPAPLRLIAGYDPVAIDAYGADILKKDFTRIDHIRMADGILGRAEPSCIEELNS